MAHIVQWCGVSYAMLWYFTKINHDNPVASLIFDSVGQDVLKMYYLFALPILSSLPPTQPSTFQILTRGVTISHSNWRAYDFHDYIWESSCPRSGFSMLFSSLPFPSAWSCSLMCSSSSFLRSSLDRWCTIPAPNASPSTFTDVRNRSLKYKKT